MSKAPSGFFSGTKGELAFYGNAENIISARTFGLDMREHPLAQKQLSSKDRKRIKQKIANRTATQKEYKQYEWDKRFRKRRRKGTKYFWKQERNRLERGEKGTRNWSEEQRKAILSGNAPKFNGKTLQGHHAYSAKLYPHLANLGEIIYPVTHIEHLYGWHGGSYKKSRPGRRIRRINEM